jgi:hypothetical protein
MSFSSFDSLLKREMVKNINERLMAISDRLCGGGVKDMEDYRHVIGQRLALLDALRWLDEIERKIMGVDGSKEG